MMQNIGIDYHCFVGERERSERLLKKKHFFCLLESVLWFVQLFGKKLQPQSFAKGISPFLVFQFIKCFFQTTNTKMQLLLEQVLKQPLKFVIIIHTCQPFVKMYGLFISFSFILISTFLFYINLQFKSGFLGNCLCFCQ